MNKKLICLSLVLICLFLNGNTVYGQEDLRPNQHEIVFMLDASNSMNGNDKTRLAIDSMAQLIYSLPSNYSIGFVAYNNDVVASEVLTKSNDREALMLTANEVRYTGYTNAGEGLLRAVALFSADDNVERTVVILSDGEIYMKNEAETQLSILRFEEALLSAKDKGIRIHVVGLGKEMENSSNTIFLAADKTEGSTYHAPLATDLQKAVDAIILDQLKIKKTTAAFIDASGGQEQFTITIPNERSSKVRILLTSTSPIENLRANFNADVGKVFRGKHYSLIEMDHPAMSSMEVGFQGVIGSKIKIDMITEYEIQPAVSVTYTDEELEDRIKRVATLEITFHDHRNTNIQVFKDQYFDRAILPMWINNTQEEAAIIDGKLKIERAVATNENLEIYFDYSKLNTNIVLSESVQVQLEAPPPLIIPPKDYSLYWILGGSIATISIIVIGIAIYRYKKSKRPPEPAMPLPTKYSYYGKLNIYVTQAPSGDDISPMTFDLFRTPSSQVISLKMILDTCKLEEEFLGADKIFFRSGANRTLILTNNSDCTILKSRELLIKNHSYQFHIDEKVDITLEDEKSELVLQYRNVKPNELRL